MSIENTVRHDVLFFLDSGASDSYLSHGCHFFGTCHDTSVVVGRSFVFATHIGMCIQLQDRELFIVFGESPECTDTNGMLSSQDHRELFVG